MLLNSTEPTGAAGSDATATQRARKNDWRLRAYPAALIAGVLIGFLTFSLGTNGTYGTWGRLGGDYPAFYAAGAMVVSGDSEHLYSFSVQQVEQSKLFPGAQADFLPYVYPPFVALAYAPLSKLPYRASYVCHTLLMLLALLLSIYVAGNSIPAMRQYPAAAFAVAIFFYPMLRAIIGGQNTALTLLLIVLAWQALATRREFISGVCLGLLLYKPQFGVICIFWFLLERRWRLACGLLVCMGALYLAGAAVSGLRWPDTWIHAVTAYRAHDEALNFDTNISLTGIAGRIAGSHDNITRGADGVASMFILLAVAWIFWRGDEHNLNLRIALASTAMLLASPHTLYYDAGVLLVVVAVFLDRFGRRATSFVMFVWIASWLQVASHAIGFSPTLPLVAIVAIVTTVALYKGAAINDRVIHA